MHALFSLDWHQLLFPQPSWLEKVLRPVLVYAFLLVIFRLASKREMAQATLFDFLIILLISNVVQNAIIGEDNSVLGAMAGATTLVLLSSWLNRTTAHSKKARVLLEGRPVLLMQGGVIEESLMKHKAISHNDLLSAIRKQGIARLRDVGFAILELDGTISIIKACDAEKSDQQEPLNCLPAEVVGDESAEINCPFHHSTAREKNS
jgi:uncharacterized membrane protein YcaP (DUF421 family)